MRAVWIVCALVAAADAAPPKQKPAPAGLSYKALRQFTSALLFEREGDLDRASRAFEDVNREAPQANAYFNLGRLELEQEDVRKAVESFTKYLELAPKAADRAEVQALIAKLGTTVYPLVIEGIVNTDEPPDAIVLVDGAVVGRSPVVLDLPVGRHDVERITSVSYAKDRVVIEPGRRQWVTPNGSSRMEKGNVVISGLGCCVSWKDSGVQFFPERRFPLPPGKYSTTVDGRLCKPLEFVVTATAELTYVRVDVERSMKQGVCDTLVRARTQVLTPGAP